jgi:hypothetical protein
LLPSAVASPGPEIRLSRVPIIESVMQVDDFGLHEKIGKIFVADPNHRRIASHADFPD